MGNLNVAGRTFGDYEILEPLGRGSVGETFLAKAVAGKHAQSVVCLKVLSSHYQSADRAMRRAAIETLQHEAEVVAELHHPNIAALLDVGVHNDSSYLVFELVTGCNLLDVMALRFVLSAKHVAHIGLQVAGALGCAHSRDIVHRDVKPTNILLSEGGEVKLVDFGLAKVRAAEASHFTQHVGTPRYWAPEQIAGDSLSPATDVFALGMVLYEALVGVHPFYDDDPAIFRRNLIAATPVRPISAPDECRELASVLDLCLRADPSQRFANGTALRNALATTVGTAEVALGQLASTARYLNGDELDEADSALGSDSQASAPCSGGLRPPLAKTDNPDSALARASQASTRLGRTADRVADIRDESRGGGARTTLALDTRALAAKAAESLPDEVDRDSIKSDLSRLARHARSHQSGLGVRATPRTTVLQVQSPVSDAAPAPERDAVTRAERRRTTAAESFGEPSTSSDDPALTPTVPRRRKTVRGFSQLGDKVREQRALDAAVAPTIHVGDAAAAAHSRAPTQVLSKHPRARHWILATTALAACAALLLAWSAPLAKHAPAARAAAKSPMTHPTIKTPLHTSAPARQASLAPTFQPTIAPLAPVAPVEAEMRNAVGPESAAKETPHSPARLRPRKTPAAVATNEKRVAGNEELVDVTIGLIPFGEVWVDGKARGNAPLTVRLTPGAHRIAGHNRGARQEQTVIVPPHAHQLVMDLRHAN